MHQPRLAIAALATIGLALTACGNQDDGDEGSKTDPTGSVTPTGTTSQTTSQPPATTDVIDLTKLEKGEDMTIPYVRGTTLHSPLKTYDLDKTYHQVLRFSDSTYVVAMNADNPYVGVINAEDPSKFELWDTTGKIVVNEEQDAVLWVGTDGDPYVLRQGQEPEPLPGVQGSYVTPIALINQDLAYLSVQRADGSMEVWTSSAEGGTARVKGIMAASDAYADSDRIWVLGATEMKDGGSCWTVLGEPGDDTWKTCDYSLDDFNTDGSKILAGPAYRDGFGDGEVAILDASDGSVLAAPELGGGAVIVGTAWEGEDTILANVYQDGEWAIVRIHADGSVDLATEPVKGSEQDGYVLGLS